MSPAIIRTNMPATPKVKSTPVMVDTPRAFRIILDNAARGQVILYYTGDLAYDRDYGPFANRGAIQRLADAVWDASSVGKVWLFQKRLSKQEFEYRAVVRR